MINPNCEDELMRKPVCSGSGLTDENEGCLTCQVRNLFVFSDLRPNELLILNQDRTSIHYHAGEAIFKQGTKPSGLLCLSRGKVKIEKESPNGNPQIVALHRASEFIGFADLIGQSVHSTSAIALEDSKICYIPKDHFLKVLQSNHTLALKVIQHLAAELLRANDRMADLTRKHMRARLADAILYAYEKYRTDKNNTSIQVELKRSDLAALSNMTTANAIRTLTEFSRDNLITVEGREITIKNLPAMRRISEMG